MEQQTGFKKEKEFIKAVCCHPAYLTYMQSKACEMPGWIKHNLESRLPGEIPVESYADETTLMAESEEELKSLFMNFPQFVVIHTVKDFSIVNEANINIFWNSVGFSVIQRMLAI